MSGTVVVPLICWPAGDGDCCGHCCRPVPDSQPDSRPQLPAGADASAAAAARCGCGVAWCSPACAAAEGPAHRLVCANGEASGSPLYEFAEIAKRSAPLPLLAGARLVSAIIADACAEATPAEASAASLAAAARLAAQLFAFVPALKDAPAKAGPSEAASETAASDEAALLKQTKRRLKRLRAAFEDRRDAIEEAGHLLNLGIAGKLEPSLRTAAKPAMLLFCRVVEALERSALTVDVENPLATQCAALLRPGNDEQAFQQSVDALLRRARLEKGRVEFGDNVDRERLTELLWAQAETCADAEDAGAAKRRVRWAEAETVDSASAWPAALPFQAGPHGAVAARRTAGLLAQCAAWLFPRVGLVVCAPALTACSHSCAPTAHLVAEDAKPASETARVVAFPRLVLLDAPPPGSPAALTPGASVRPTNKSIAPRSIAWVDVSGSASSREFDLEARWFRALCCDNDDDDDFVTNVLLRNPRTRCACFRCVCECGTLPQPEDNCDEKGDEKGDTSDCVAVARLAIDGDRVDDGVSLLKRRLSAAPDDGDAWATLGVALINQGKWPEAHAAFGRGAARDSSHATLSAQRVKDVAYQRSPAEEGRPEATAYSLGAVLSKYDRLAVGADGGQVLVSRGSVVSEADCAFVIAEAEKHCTDNGGWATQRHSAVPTTDVAVHHVPAVLAWFKTILAAEIAPLLSAAFRHADGSRFAPEDVRCHDAFVVKYVAGAQASLPFHTDESTLSLTLTLNSSSEFDGGGTFFADLGRALPGADYLQKNSGPGRLVAFDGRLLHGGDAIVRGERYVVAAFLFVDDARGAARLDDALRPAGPAAKRRKTDEVPAFSFGFAL